ncbi:hypothetical protein AC1031_001234 [Aphanomyces cochlioides]|nr:hypothetical protein AC1031_001234 [Aphanomyces cochlioides]
MYHRLLAEEYGQHHARGEQQNSSALGSVLATMRERSEAIHGRQEHCACRAPAPFEDSVAYFAVYDGHNGSATSNALQADLHHRILSHWGQGPTTAIELGCAQMDEELLQKDTERIAAQKNESLPAPMTFSGAAAVVAIVTTQEQLGDTIEAAGGFVHNGRLDDILAISRAFCDYAHKSGGHLIAVPEVTSDVVDPEDHFVHLVSDGLFDVLSSQQAINFIRRKLRDHSDVQLAAQELVLKAQEYVSHDNISAIVVCFNQVYIISADGKRLPYPNKELQKIFVRTCYEDIYALLMAKIENGVEAFGISGTPGIGKSLFLSTYCTAWFTTSPPESLSSELSIKLLSSSKCSTWKTLLFLKWKVLGLRS